MTNKNLTSNEAKSLVSRLGPSLGCGDFTYDPVFPKTRKDVCAVRRMAENGSDYGYDTIYLIWKNNKGLQNQELMNSSSSKDYVHINEVIETEKDIVVKVSSGGSYSGHAWKDKIATSKKELGLK
jgi:hypothetical protein